MDCSNGGGDFKETTMGIEMLDLSDEEQRATITFPICNDSLIEDTEYFQVSFKVMEDESSLGDRVVYLRTNTQTAISITDTTGMLSLSVCFEDPSFVL